MRILPALALLAATANAQHIVSPKTSIVDVAARQAALASTTDPRLREAIKKLHSCMALSDIPAPAGRMNIPHHYLSGSSGPTDPKEAIAEKLYNDFETRVVSGMNQYLATGSHQESACALAQMDEWAKAGALLDYDRSESTQAWFQIEWTVSAIGISESVLVNDATLDAAQQQRVIAWLDTVTHKDISQEKSSDTMNNHHYWRGLAATVVGIVANDQKLFDTGIDTYKQAITEIDSRGAFPKEMARHENASHYQGFALQPLVAIAELAARQQIDLYGYKANDRTVRDAIVFYGLAADDASLVKPYTNDVQKGGFKSDDFGAFEFFVARFGQTGLPPAIGSALKHPTTLTRLGGSTTLLASGK